VIIPDPHRFSTPIPSFLPGEVWREEGEKVGVGAEEEREEQKRGRGRKGRGKENGDRRDGEGERRGRGKEKGDRK